MNKEKYCRLNRFIKLKMALAFLMILLTLVLKIIASVENVGKIIIIRTLFDKNQIIYINIYAYSIKINYKIQVR